MRARCACERASEKESKLRRVERSQPPAFPGWRSKNTQKREKSEIGIGIEHNARTLADTRFSTRCTTKSHKRPHRRGDRRGLCLEGTEKRANWQLCTNQGKKIPKLKQAPLAKHKTPARKLKTKATKAPRRRLSTSRRRRRQRRRRGPCVGSGISAASARREPERAPPRAGGSSARGSAAPATARPRGPALPSPTPRRLQRRSGSSPREGLLLLVLLLLLLRLLLLLLLHRRRHSYGKHSH